MTASKKPTLPKNRPTKKSIRTHLTLGDTLQQRASAYSAKSGLSIPALLRNGLDALLKQNNF